MKEQGETLLLNCGIPAPRDRGKCLVIIDMAHDLEPPKKRPRISGEGGRPDLIPADGSGTLDAIQVIDADDQEEESMELEERQELRASDLYLDTVSTDNCLHFFILLYLFSISLMIQTGQSSCS